MIVRSRLTDVDIPKDVTVTDVILRAADTQPNRIALIDARSGRRYTYSQLKRSIINASWALRMRGFSRGDVACFCSTNNAEYVIMFHAVLSLGGVVTPINPSYTAGELNGHLRLTDSVYLFTNSATLKNLSETVKNSSKVRAVYLFDRVPGYTSCLDFFEGHQTSLPDVSIDTAQDTAVIPTSSGTTGLPKGIMLTHLNLMAAMLQFSHKEVAVFCGDHDIVPFTIPLFHIYGITVIMLGALFKKATVIIFERFNLELFLDSVEKHKATVLPLVPPLIVLLTKHTLVDRFNLSSVKRIFFGAAPIGKETIEEFRRKRGSGIKLLQAYGLTEMSPLITSSRINDVTIGSVGVVLSNTSVKIIDIETSEPVAVGKEGEICARGPQMMKGYVSNAKATADMIDQDGWLHTGDIGCFDEAGNLYITGRLKELIKYNAFQVAPAELETILLTHPGIADAGVIGVPDESAGEVPRAYVVRKEGAHVTAPEVVAYMAERTASYKQLRGGVFFIDSIPKTASGKILRKKLAERAAAEKQTISRL